MPYPQAPSRRMAHDADGSVALYRLSSDSGATFGPQVQLTPTQHIELNDEDNVDTGPNHSTSGHRSWWSVIFPELREFDGFFARANAGPRLFNIESSADTTNGVDGIWTSETTDYSDPDSDVFANYRTVTAFARSNVRAVRLFLNNQVGGQPRHMRALHIYGEISAGETPDRLLFIDEDTGLEFTIPEDWGDVPRGGSEDRQLRLKNNSATLVADTVQYTTEALYRVASAGWYTFTLPGGSTYQATQQIASIGAATTTGVITARRITPGAEDLGLFAARLFANVGSWS